MKHLWGAVAVLDSKATLVVDGCACYLCVDRSFTCLHIFYKDSINLQCSLTTQGI